MTSREGYPYKVELIYTSVLFEDLKNFWGFMRENTDMITIYDACRGGELLSSFDHLEFFSVNLIYKYTGVFLHLALIEFGIRRRLHSYANISSSMPSRDASSRFSTQVFFFFFFGDECGKQESQKQMLGEQAHRCKA